MKPPFKDEPLANPGESLDRSIQEYLLDKILEPAMIAILALALALIEWIRWWMEVPPTPAFMTIFAVAAIAFAGWRLRKTLPGYRALKLGRDGEKYVGQFLEDIRKLGGRVIHDVPGPGFNLDHVILHSSGAYVIETKTRSKPEHGQTKIVFDGDALYVNNGPANTAPLVQVRAARDWLASRLRSMTGKQYPVRGVLVFPGWYVESTGAGRRSDIWVLHEAGVLKFIERERSQLTNEQLSFAADCLARYARGERQ